MTQPHWLRLHPLRFPEITVFVDENKIVMVGPYQEVRDGQTITGAIIHDHLGLPGMEIAETVDEFWEKHSQQ